MAEVLWNHPDPTSTPMWHFLQRIKDKHGLKEDTYAALYAWSVENVNDFWEECWDAVGIEASVGYEHVSVLIVEGREKAASEPIYDVLLGRE